MSSTAETLRRARALIEDEEHWCQGQMRRWGNGHIVRRCAYSALCDMVSSRISQPRRTTEYWGSLASDRELAAADMLSTASRSMYGETVAFVNDDLGHAAVLRMYDRAIEMAEEADRE